MSVSSDFGDNEDRNAQTDYWRQSSNALTERLTERYGSRGGVINAGNAVSKLVHAVSTSFALKLASSTAIVDV